VADNCRTVYGELVRTTTKQLGQLGVPLRCHLARALDDDDAALVIAAAAAAVGVQHLCFIS